MSFEIALFWSLLFGLSGWGLYLREREKSRDYVTDLSQLIYDYDLGRDDLHRSLRWSEVEDSVDQEGDRHV